MKGGVIVKLDLEKKFKFWSDDFNVATGAALIGLVIASAASTTEFLKRFMGLGIYIGCLIVIWGALSGAKIMDSKPNTISFGKMLVLSSPCILFMILIIIFG